MGAKSRRRRAKRATKTPPTKTLPRGTVERFNADDKTQKIPRSALEFDAPCLFDLAGLAADDDAADDASSRGAPRRAAFESVVNSGEVISHPFWGQFAIDMDGLQIPTKTQPVLRDHDTTKILGVTSDVRVTDGKTLEAKGELLDVTQDGEEVIGLAEAGFPFQMSIFVPPLQILEVLEGEEVEVNGHKLTGPGTIFKKSTLREVTVTPLGADPNTSLALLSRGSQPGGGDSVAFSVSQLSTARKDMDDEEETGEAGTVTAAEAERLTAEAVEAATQAERTRLVAIDDLTAGLSIDPEVVSKWKLDGLTAEKVAVEVVKLAKAGKSAMLSALTGDSPDLSADEGDEAEHDESTATGDGGATPPKPTAKLTAKQIAEMPEKLEHRKPNNAKFEAEWDANVGGCRDSDDNAFESKDEYLAYRRHTPAGMSATRGRV